MAGTGYQSSDILATFNRLAGRPATDPISDADKYQRLAQAQDEIVLDQVGLCGKVLYSAPTAMTLAAGSLTATFGVDGNGYALFLLDGYVYPSLNAIPQFPWNPGVDYLDEGTTIRSLNQVPFSVTPYYYGVVSPQYMSASVQPVLQPPQVRNLIAVKAAANFLQEGGRNAEQAATLQARYDREWARDTVAIRKHFRSKRALGPLTSGGPGMGGWSGYGWAR